MTKFNKANEINLKRLEQYVPVVDRVHGNNHPEFHRVRDLFEVINQKSKKAGADKLELANEFNRLREITDNYSVPDDVCESYEAVYNMLSELDKAYQE
ncbi:MAG: iron-sulfur cluster repair di-iron protein, ric [Herbinix sp.]|nr:iron-sulfur cluster repair di-iron protein, ric [Herbinix sp.]